MFACGVGSNATAVKVNVLGVPEDLLATYGVVSEECARSMGRGRPALLRTTYGVSTTGVAGPDTQEGKPVGTVFVGVSSPTGTNVLCLTVDNCSAGRGTTPSSSSGTGAGLLRRPALSYAQWL